MTEKNEFKPESEFVPGDFVVWEVQKRTQDCEYRLWSSSTRSWLKLECSYMIVIAYHKMITLMGKSGIQNYYHYDIDLGRAVNCDRHTYEAPQLISLKKF